MEEEKKLYSKRSIDIATFFGGPMVAGYLVKKNLEALEQPENARKSMFFGVMGTILILVLGMILPTWLVDIIPNSLIPFIYTGIIMYLVEKTHGKDIRSHKEAGGKFHSGWKAAGIAFIGTLILVAAGISVLYLSGDLKYFNPAFNATKYEKQMTLFQENEDLAMQVYRRFENGEKTEYLVHDLYNVTDLYKENITIIQKIEQDNNIPDVLHEHNELLKKYCYARIDLTQLLIKSIKEDTDKYDPDIQEKIIQIQTLMSEIEKSIAEQ